MKKVLLSLLLLGFINFQAKAEFEIDYSSKFSVSSETIKISKNGLLMGEYGYNYYSMPFNGVYFDNSGNLDFKPKVLASYKITDLDEDSDYYYTSSYMVVNGMQGLFKISKDFSKFENIGLKAATRKILQYKNKVYTGGYTHGCYVVNKDGTGLFQILGDGYFGPQIDDLKANSKNVYVLSRGLLYKVDYETNQKELLIFGYRPSYIEVDDEKLYLTSGNMFYNLSFDNKVSNQKYFPGNISFLKKYKNLIIVSDSDTQFSYFWFSNDNGKNFFKSTVKIPLSNSIKDIEVVGDKIYTIYLNLSNLGVVKSKLIFDFMDQKIFSSPFKISKDSDILDKITTFFDHRFPYLGNMEEPNEYKNTTLNFDGKELKQPLMYYSSHDGIDWGLPLNTPIYSTYQGYASYFYQPQGLGNAIKISHPNGYITIYGHLADEGLITKNNIVYVEKGQKIGNVGMTGNTTGPHLHFTAYFGDKLLNNKLDPFGWNGNFTDPWSEIGQTSLYLWDIKSQGIANQLNPSISKNLVFENINIDTINLSFLNIPINLEIFKTAPIFDSKNYLYKANTSIKSKITNFYSDTTPSTIIGKINFSGFKIGDDKYYSIWKTQGDSIQKLDTFFDLQTNSLSTIFEPSSEYIVLKDNFRKIIIKNTSIVKK